MIEARDSAYPPSSSAVQAALAAGVKGWWGYGQTRSGVNILNPWSQADFDRVRPLNDRPVMFTSGLDDPVACRQLADFWHVLLCLDVEDGICADGPWVPGWLAASGAGLYGNAGVFPGRTAAFYILSAYPSGGDPGGESWPSAGWAGPRPAGPCAWQWAGSHPEFGFTVDSTWADDWFGPAVTSGRKEVSYEYWDLPAGTHAVKGPLNFSGSKIVRIAVFNDSPAAYPGPSAHFSYQLVRDDFASVGALALDGRSLDVPGDGIVSVQPHDDWAGHSMYVRLQNDGPANLRGRSGEEFV